MVSFAVRNCHPVDTLLVQLVCSLDTEKGLAQPQQQSVSDELLGNNEPRADDADDSKTKNIISRQIKASTSASSPSSSNTHQETMLISYRGRAKSHLTVVESLPPGSPQSTITKKAYLLLVLPLAQLM